MSGGGAPSLHRSVPGWRWVPAGARGRAGTVNRSSSRAAEPGSGTCDPAFPMGFYRRPSSPIEIYFHSWKKSMGCGYCCSRCFLCGLETQRHTSVRCGHRFCNTGKNIKEIIKCIYIYFKPATVVITQKSKCEN